MLPDELEAQPCRKEENRNGEVAEKVDVVKVDAVKIRCCKVEGLPGDVLFDIGVYFFQPRRVAIYVLRTNATPSRLRHCLRPIALTYSPTVRVESL
jgi:hypothetical protein